MGAGEEAGPGGGPRTPSFQRLVGVVGDRPRFGVRDRPTASAE